MNLYEFVRNNSFNYIDNFGLADYGILGARCCNNTNSDEYALTGSGEWTRLGPGECTGLCEDCDGMTCGGYFYAETGGIALFGGLNCSSRPGSSPRQRWSPFGTDAGFHNGPSPYDRGLPLPEDDDIPLPDYPWRS